MGKNLKKIFFIAEIASSHNGSQKNLSNIVEKLIKSDVEAIKLQIFDHKKLAHSTYKYHKILKKISIKKNFMEKIISKILKKKKNVILEPFDDNSFKFCMKFKRRVSVKISSSDNNDKNRLKDSLINFKNVFYSISSMNIDKIRNNLGKYIKNKNIILTYGFQSFPTNINDLRLNFIEKLKREKFKVCYADHTNSNSLVDNILAINMAIKNGSNYIEKHVTLNKNKGYPDSDSSLEIDEFKELLKFYKKKIPNKNLISKNEKKYSKIMTRYAVLKKNVKKNSSFKEKDIMFLRTGVKGITLDRIKYYKKKIYNRNLSKNDIIQKKFFH